MKQRWRSLRSDVLSDAALTAKIDTLTAPLVNAADRNFKRWPNLEDAELNLVETPAAPTWQGQVQFMRDWLAARVVWIDAEW